MDSKIVHSPKHKDTLKLIKIAEGHLVGIEKMIESDRYCIDISKQILALIAILKKANTEILKRHLETCVKSAAKGENFDEKIKELESIIEYLSKGRD
ncbi:putative copper-sensing transcriptional repressor [Caldisericum exile AZM16c01]|uniref:Copper-sensing transcriptional repressor CsoR n=2 Tax=Caldisericum exile TaxID=693075 RepID=A0A7U6GDB1_CALEA|nr:putative copper-sensing transcriptional repressor [Caldisericum exile AZM16c01]